jgi:hypothetical protein
MRRAPWRISLVRSAAVQPLSPSRPRGFCAAYLPEERRTGQKIPRTAITTVRTYADTRCIPGTLVRPDSVRQVVVLVHGGGIRQASESQPLGLSELSNRMSYSPSTRGGAARSPRWGLTRRPRDQGVGPGRGRLRGVPRAGRAVQGRHVRRRYGAIRRAAERSVRRCRPRRRLRSRR